jgi:hypothetical protein
LDSQSWGNAFDPIKDGLEAESNESVWLYNQLNQFVWMYYHFQLRLITVIVIDIHKSTPNIQFQHVREWCLISMTRMKMHPVGDNPFHFTVIFKSDWRMWSTFREIKSVKKFNTLPNRDRFNDQPWNAFDPIPFNATSDSKKSDERNRHS